MKYVSPYYEVGNQNQFLRIVLGENSGYSVYRYFSIYEDKNMWSHVNSLERFSSKEEAMESMDKYLRDLGYEFLTQEQFDKMKILI